MSESEKYVADLEESSEYQYCRSYAIICSEDQLNGDAHIELSIDWKSILVKVIMTRTERRLVRSPRGLSDEKFVRHFFYENLEWQKQKARFLC